MRDNRLVVLATFASVLEASRTLLGRILAWNTIPAAASAVVVLASSHILYGSLPPAGWADPAVYQSLSIGLGHSTYHADRVGVYAIPETVNRLLPTSNGFRLASLSLLFLASAATVVILGQLLSDRNHSVGFWFLAVCIPLSPVFAQAVLSGTAQGRVLAYQWAAGSLLLLPSTKTCIPTRRGTACATASGVLHGLALLSHPVAVLTVAATLISLRTSHTRKAGRSALTEFVVGLVVVVGLGWTFARRREIRLFGTDASATALRSLDGVGEQFIAPNLLFGGERWLPGLSVALFVLLVARTNTQRALALLPTSLVAFDLLFGGALTSLFAYTPMLLTVVPLALMPNSGVTDAAGPAHRQVLALAAIVGILSFVHIPSWVRLTDRGVQALSEDASLVMSQARPFVLAAPVTVTVLHPSCGTPELIGYVDFFRGEERRWNACDGVVFGIHGTLSGRASGATTSSGEARLHIRNGSFGPLRDTAVREPPTASDHRPLGVTSDSRPTSWYVHAVGAAASRDDLTALLEDIVFAWTPGEDPEPFARGDGAHETSPRDHHEGSIHSGEDQGGAEGLVPMQIDRQSFAAAATICEDMGRLTWCRVRLSAALTAHPRTE